MKQTKKLGRTTFTNVEELPEFPGLYIQKYPEKSRIVIRSENDDDVARIIVTKEANNDIIFDLFGGSLTESGIQLHLNAVQAAIKESKNLLIKKN